MKSLQEGAYITHFHYGLGVMAASDAERIPLDLDIHGLKKSAVKTMVVKLADGTPRRQPKRSKKATGAGHTAGAK